MPDSAYSGTLTPTDIIATFDTVFSVDVNDGSVRRLSNGRTIRPYIGNPEGHAFVRLYHGKRRKTIAVHRLVWMFATRAEIPPKFEIHHRDHDTANNAFDNLVCVHYLDHRKLHADDDADDVPF